MNRKLHILGALLIGLIAPLAATAFTPTDEYASEQTDVKVWLDEANGSVLRPGERVRVYFTSATDCYVAVYDIDTDGFVSLLYPRYGDPGWVEGGRVMSIPESDDAYDLIVDGRRGIEYVVAVASNYPMNFASLGASDDGYRGSSYATTARITGDPQDAIYELNEALAWGNEGYAPDGVASDIGWFYIERRVPYPRYLVYQWYPDHYWNSWWDPYDNVDIFVDFRWGHDWCRPHWWGRGYGHSHHHDYWYTLRGHSDHVKWKGVVVNDGWRPPHREKQLRDRDPSRASKVTVRGPGDVREKDSRGKAAPFDKWNEKARRRDVPQRDDKPRAAPGVRGERKPESRPQVKPAQPRPEKAKGDEKNVKKQEEKKAEPKQRTEKKNAGDEKPQKKEKEKEPKPRSKR